MTSSRKRDGAQHKVGTETGHYTSAEAAAKPLAAFLAAAGRTRAQVDAYLDELRGDKISPWLSVFLHPDVTGITANDVYTLHAPGTSTKSGRRLWEETRDGAVAGRGETPAVREIDAVTGGARPGSVILFVKSDTGRWRLVTSYFTGCPESSDTPYTEL